MAALFALFLVASLPLVTPCTLVAVGKKATKDGSAIVAHTDDAGGGAADLRLVHVPAADWPQGSMRPVYNFASGYPRYVGKDRGPVYAPRENQTHFEPVGHIPQVRHTFAYWDQDYGLMNEKQLAIAETSCGARTVGWSKEKPYGKNLFSIAELSRIALERCETARCAIQTMGDLGVEHGFYDEDSGTPARPGYADSAESLAIADRSGEVWMFSILTGIDGGSAIWAAQRVPDDHIAVNANGFTIREMDLKDTDNFMASPNIHSAAIEAGWWDPAKEPFDFTAIYSDAGSGAVPAYYLGRRMWRVYMFASPTLNLDPYLGQVNRPKTYEFSYKSETAIGPDFFFHAFRDHYEGTEFDMTKGIAAGPFGNPIRYDTPTYNVSGGWERSIAMYRAAFSFVCQTRSWLPDQIGGVFWYSHDNPTGSFYVPVYGAQSELPDSYLNCLQSKFSRGCSWWAANFVNNWMQLRYNAMIVDIQMQQSETENGELENIAEVERRALKIAKQDPEAAFTFLHSWAVENAQRVTDTWWVLADHLVTKYTSGYVTTGELPSQQRMLGYPQFWLAATDYNGWPHHKIPSWIYIRVPPAPLPAKPDPAHPGAWVTADVTFPGPHAAPPAVAPVPTPTAGYSLPTEGVRSSAELLLVLLVGVALGTLLSTWSGCSKRREYVSLDSTGAKRQGHYGAA